MLSVVGNGSGNPIRKLLPKVLAVAAAGCTVLLAVVATQADDSVLWALPAAVYLVGAILLMTPAARRRGTRMPVAAVMVIAAVGIGAAFYILYGRQPSALLFGGMFLVFAVLEMLAPATPQPA